MTRLGNKSVRICFLGRCWPPQKWRRILFRRLRSSYPSAGCSSAEPASVSLDEDNLAARAWISREASVAELGAFKLTGRLIAQGAVQPLAVVEDFDVIEEGGVSLFARRESVLLPVDQF